MEADRTRTARDVTGETNLVSADWFLLAIPIPDHPAIDL
jgi:hypothetical protein